jgi:prolyl-tRNA editing enzyme YbaK/EbsC (Cys-tRNA(Pro) deacylase)
MSRASASSSSTRNTIPVADTQATVFLKSNGVAYTEHEYDYVEHGGTEISAQALGVPEHEVVKTLVMQDEDARPLIVLMHGDRKVSERSIRDLPRVYINGGRRGFLLRIRTEDLEKTLKPQLVDVALED